MRRCSIIRPFLGALLLISGSVSLTGCEALSPTQLWKLNRHPRESYGGDAYFSIPNGTTSAMPVTSQNNGIPQVAAF